MSDHPENIEVVKESIDRERSNLLTVIAALAFLSVCLFVSNISMGAYAVGAVNERDAVSIALDDQRRQYHECTADHELTSLCDEEIVSPPSRDIRRDLEGAGFSDILYSDHGTVAEEDFDERPTKNNEAFGLLGRVIYR